VKNIHLVTDDKAVLKTVREHVHSLEKEIFTKTACFSVCKAGFSANAYIRAKTNAELDSEKTQSAAAADFTGVPKNVKHPELYARLLQWRKDAAEELDMDLHEVLPARSLQELVEFLPTSRASLKQIKGIGRGKLKRFGSALIGIIQQYCTQKQITTNATAAETPKLNHKPSSL
jgi:superfamily II DNA helicase RecQ